MATTNRTLTIKRVGEQPKNVKLTLNVNSNTDPDVARWIWEHPYVASGMIRKLIRNAIARDRANGHDSAQGARPGVGNDGAHG
ncbi:MAG TPA: hypothetical protein VFQ88_15285 [Nevskiaceae bacterium]|nr:hypothetical protein [Nevskiaceae bacterium]